MIYLNDEPLEPTIFPDGTSQVWKVGGNVSLIKAHHRIRWEFSREKELVHLMQLMTLIRANHSTAELKIFYLPYGRQDKGVNDWSTFGLYSFAGLINGLEFTKVEILDPHSYVALDLIKRSSAYFPTPEVFRASRETNSHVFCYPDLGAMRKYRDTYRHAYIYGHKHRDQSTGHILSLNLMHDSQEPFDVRGLNILIVDDICDGGGTFTRLSEKLLFEAKAKEVNLFVTYGIFSKGIEILKDAGIKRIFTFKGEVTSESPVGNAIM